MRCPYCGGPDTQVKDSRPSDDAAAIRRRRVCPDCGGRFTTFERVQLRELTVLKRSGKRVPFDRDKLQRSIGVALRKRPVDPERVERLVSGITRQLESSGEAEIGSEAIGELVMEGLKGLDDVAYVRFASVYKNFREASDFKALLGTLAPPVAQESAAPEPECDAPSGELPPQVELPPHVTPLRAKRQTRSSP
ncbi:transcriptional regulator NrdR [Methylobacterium goesingense]|uniref:Transcriptional repressor NrdR n=1 Tax=Methylobacterium goesingense TaxID=243690 RepID=A0ABV2L8K2_9HYPH|nr:transcriptional regulator NrdR [Methylobacterium goesingense]GJD75174.1 Transcriptional repressor NrdR [Methylobacterium goesingense]